MPLLRFVLVLCVALSGFGTVAPAQPAPEIPPIALPARPETVPAPADVKIPDRPLSRSAIVVNDAVAQKSGQPIDGIKLSQHDMDINSPSIAVAPNGVIHVAFLEKHRTTYAVAVYHRSSSDGGKTWTEAKNLSESMVNLNIGRCVVLVDSRERVYVIWKAGLGQYFPVSALLGQSSQSNLVYRVLENGQWSKILPVHPPGSASTQDDGSLAFYAAIDGTGRAQVAWNAEPDKWHPELTHTSGTYHQHLVGVGNGLVFQATLDGKTATAPREVYLSPVAGQDLPDGYGTYCDGLEGLNGYFDDAGAPHFVAAISSYHDQSLAHVSRYQLIENGKPGPWVDLPELSYHAWGDIPRLLTDAAGRRHLIVLYPAGERPNIRDYLLGSDEDPVVIREAASVKGTADSFDAYQGPNGRMVAVMQMNDSGDRGSGDTYVSVSWGQGWSAPVNVTNNAGRKSFAARATSRVSSVAVIKSYHPGRAAAAFDREGHLLLLMVNNEFSIFGVNSAGIELAGGNSSTPTLQFLRF